MGGRLISKLWTRATLVGMVLAVGACSSPTEPTPAPTPTPAPPPASVTLLSVTGAAPNVGGSAQLNATAAFSDGTTRSVTSQSTWRSSNPAVASVSSTGVVTGVAPGSVNITATFQAANASTPLTIPQPVTPTLSVTGRVTDGTSGAALAGADVTVITGPNAGRSGRTDSTGRYTIASITAGTMTLRADAHDPSDYHTLDRTLTVTTPAQLDFALPRVPATPPAPVPPTPAPPTGSGAFVRVDTNAITCSCSRGTIRVASNNVQIGTTGCAPQSRTFSVAPGNNRIVATDDLGSWNPIDLNVAAGQTGTVLLTCTSGAGALPEATAKTGSIR